MEGIKLGKIVEQKCWRCANYIDGCSWARSLELPKGAVVDERGNIIKCPEYIADKSEKKHMTGNEMAAKFGISKRTFMRRLDSYLIRYYNISGMFIYNNIIYDESEIKKAKNRLRIGALNPYRSTGGRRKKSININNKQGVCT